MGSDYIHADISHLVKNELCCGLVGLVSYGLTGRGEVRNPFRAFDRLVVEMSSSSSIWSSYGNIV